MIENEFVFDNGIAIVRRIDNKQVMLSQPGKPGDSGLEPWANEEQAREWVYQQFDHFFRDYTQEQMQPSPDLPAPDDSQPPNPPPTQQGSGA